MYIAPVKEKNKVFLKRLQDRIMIDNAKCSTANISRGEVRLVVLQCQNVYYKIDGAQISVNTFYYQVLFESLPVYEPIILSIS